jgi:hypothetical protein
VINDQFLLVGACRPERVTSSKSTKNKSVSTLKCITNKRREVNTIKERRWINEGAWFAGFRYVIWLGEGEIKA